MLKNLRGQLRKAMNTALPNQCIFCLVKSNETICRLCFDALPKLTIQCPKCAEPNQHGELCGRCISRPPSFSKVISPFIYSGAIKHLIINLKRRPLSTGQDLLNNRLANLLSSSEFDYIVPIPYHWFRLLSRGHNPVREIAYQVAKTINTPLIDALACHHPRAKQKLLNRLQRLNNLQGVYSIANNSKLKQLKNKNILLIDDVVTTGATINNAARALKAFGVKSVTVACLARTANHK